MTFPFSPNLYLIARLASGTTWQSSGQVLHIQNSVIETHFVKYSRQLYEKLHKEGHDIGNSISPLQFLHESHRFHLEKETPDHQRTVLLECTFFFSSQSGFVEKGSLWVAQTSDRLHTLKRQYAIIKALGVNCEILNVENFKEKVPIIDPHEIWVCLLTGCLARALFLLRVGCGCTMISWLIPSRLLWPLRNSPSRRVRQTQDDLRRATTIGLCSFRCQNCRRLFGERDSHREATRGTIRSRDECCHLSGQYQMWCVHQLYRIGRWFPPRRDKRTEEFSVLLLQWARELGYESSPGVRIPTQACGKWTRVEPHPDWTHLSV